MKISNYNKIILFIILIFIGCKEEKREYYSDGKLMRKYEINSDGEIDGKYRAFYPSGKLRREGLYKNGLETGEFKIYYENSQIDEIANFKEGILNGKYLKYYDNGILEEESFFLNGLRDGITKAYFRNEKIKNIMIYEKGKIHGEFYEYFENGQLFTYAICEQDSPAYIEKYNESGKLIDNLRQIKVRSITNDTIALGEEYKVKITSSGRIPLGPINASFRFYARNIAHKVEISMLYKYSYGISRVINEPELFSFLLQNDLREIVLHDIAKDIVVEKEIKFDSNNSFVYSYFPNEIGSHILACEFEIKSEKDSVKFITPFQLVFYVSENNKIAKLGGLLNSP